MRFKEIFSRYFSELDIRRMQKEFNERMGVEEKELSCLFDPSSAPFVTIAELRERFAEEDRLEREDMTGQGGLA